MANSEWEEGLERGEKIPLGLLGKGDGEESAMKADPHFEKANGEESAMKADPHFRDRGEGCTSGISFGRR